MDSFGNWRELQDTDDETTERGTTDESYNSDDVIESSFLQPQNNLVIVSSESDDEFSEYTLGNSNFSGNTTTTRSELSLIAQHNDTFTSLSEDEDLKEAIKASLETVADTGIHEVGNLATSFERSVGLSNSLNGHEQSANHSMVNGDISDEQQTLLAERRRLSIEMSQVTSSLNNKITALSSANINTLPDRGMRLRNSISREETSLKNLQEQLNRVNNKLKLSPRQEQQMVINLNDSYSPKKLSYSPQSMSNGSMTGNKKGGSKQTSSIEIVESPPRFGVLPSVNTEDMGKKALEMHQNQQVMIVQSLRSLHSTLQSCPPEKSTVSDPVDLNTKLMKHQTQALAWLLWREKEKPSGGILADDMGLGKTLTMISLILKSMELKNSAKSDSGSDDDEDEENSIEGNWRQHKRYPGGTLVVCPASILGQWESEINKRVKQGTLSVMIHHGPKRDKKPRRLARPDVVITSYTIVRNDAEGPLSSVKWERVILDEAHVVRNYKSQTAMSVFKLVTKHRWCLTGTPIHNKQVDLFALIKFLRCSPFDDLAVWKKWIETKEDSGEKRLNVLTKSLMLRRTKEVLIDEGQLEMLPEKSVECKSINLKKEESALYEEVLNFSKTLFAQFLQQKAEKADALVDGVCFNKKSKQFEGDENPFAKHPTLAKLYNKMNGMPDIKTHEILVILLRLRQICCHPSLIKKALEKDSNVNDGIQHEDGTDLDLLEKLSELSLTGNNLTEEEDRSETSSSRLDSVFDPKNPIFNQEYLSSKFEATLEVLENDILKKEEKVIIVSQWTTLLELFHDVLRLRGIKSKLLTGKVPVDERIGMVDKFNSSSMSTRVLLLSLTAGGTGLNLVGANNLILIDLHWNPQLEAQACDRIYRVGQKKPVKIYKFVCSDTIEERIQQLQQTKLDLAEGVLTGVKRSNAKLTLNDLKMLFNIT